MNKRKAALFLALCLVLAGCGQKADAKDSVSETEEMQNTDTTAQKPEIEAAVDNTTEPKYLTLDISTMGEMLADGDVVAPIEGSSSIIRFYSWNYM